MFADGDAVTRLQEFVQIALQDVVGEAGHGHRLVSRRERQAQRLRRRLGIAVVQLVEVAHAEEQQHAGVLFLGVTILLHEGVLTMEPGTSMGCFALG